MINRYKDLNLNQLLQPIGSPIDKGINFMSGYDFDSMIDREFINEVAMRTDSVSTRTIQDLAVTDAKILTLTANKITAGTIDASVISVINLDADNITSGSIDASNIDVININANYITSGTIDADTIRLKDLNAGELSSGTVSADRIGANSITASKIDVDYLSALAANMGTLTSGLINGGTITGVLITTTSSGRINIKGSGAMQFQDSGGSNQGQIYGQNTTPSMIIAPTSGVQVSGAMSVTGALDVEDVVDIDELGFDPTSSNYDNHNYEIWAYDSSEKGFRCRVNGSLYQFDLTSK